MCNIAEERMKIEKLLHDTASQLLQQGISERDELADACLKTLYDNYGSNCPDRCIEAKVESFLLETTTGSNNFPAYCTDNAFSSEVDTGSREENARIK
jgi:hypothetical protein